MQGQTASHNVCSVVLGPALFCAAVNLFLPVVQASLEGVPFAAASGCGPSADSSFPYTAADNLLLYNVGQ